MKWPRHSFNLRLRAVIIAFYLFSILLLLTYRFLWFEMKKTFSKSNRLCNDNDRNQGEQILKTERGTATHPTIDNNNITDKSLWTCTFPPCVVIQFRVIETNDSPMCVSVCRQCARLNYSYVNSLFIFDMRFYMFVDGKRKRNTTCATRKSSVTKIKFSSFLVTIHYEHDEETEKLKKA